MKKTRETFSLVPSDRTTGEAAAPMSVLPAVPLILPDNGNLKTLGIIDTSAAFCCISERLVDDGRFGEVRHERQLYIRSVGGDENRVPIIRIDLIIASANFEPWLRLKGISFAVQPGKQWISDAAGIILGYSGCLEHLNVQFNFPERVVSISAPENFEVSRSKNDELIESGRLREAEVLVQNGAFDSAIVMAAAAIEDFVSSKRQAGPEGFRIFPLWRLSLVLPGDMRISFASIMRLRNEAVHGGGRSALTQEDAERVINDARKILRQLAKRASAPSA